MRHDARLARRSFRRLLGGAVVAWIGLSLVTPARSDATTTTSDPVPVGVRLIPDRLTFDESGEVSFTIVNGSPDARTIVLRAGGGGSAPSGPGWACDEGRCEFTVDLPAGASRVVRLQDASSKDVPVVASSTDGSLDRLVVGHRPPTTFVPWWESWWSDRLWPALKLLLELAAAAVIASAVASIGADLVPRPAHRGRPEHLRAVGFAVIGLGGLRWLVAGEDFPEGAGWFRRNVFRLDMPAGVPIVVGAALVALVAAIVVLGGWERRPGSSVFQVARWRDRRWMLIGAGLVLAAACLAVWPGASHDRLARWIGFGLVVVGVVLVGWQAMYTPSVHFDAATKDADAAKVAVALPAALAAVNDSDLAHLRTVQGSDQVSPASKAIAAVPETSWGKIVLAAVGALLPQTGYELHLASTSGDRVRVDGTLRRGRTVIGAFSFDSDDAHPSGAGKGPAGHDSLRDAALATASWFDLTLEADINPGAHRWGRYGATDWCGLAYDVIGRQYSSAGDADSAFALFERARGQDAGSLPAAMNACATLVRSGGDLPECQDRVRDLTCRVEHQYPGSPLHQRVAYLDAVIANYVMLDERKKGTQRAHPAAVKALEKAEHVLDLMHQAATGHEPAGRSGLPEGDSLLRGRHRRPAAEFARLNYGAAKVLHDKLVLAAQDGDVGCPHKDANEPASASTQYNDACRRVDRSDFAGAWRALSEAVTVVRYAPMALADPALAPLFGLFADQPGPGTSPVPSPSGKPVYLELFAGRLDELGRTMPGAPPDLVSLGFSGVQAVALARALAPLPVRVTAGLGTALRNQLYRTKLGPAFSADLMVLGDRCALAAEPCVGVRWARVLAEVGLAAPGALARANVTEIAARVAGWLSAHPDSELKQPTMDVIRAWAAIDLP